MSTMTLKLDNGDEQQRFSTQYGLKFFFYKHLESKEMSFDKFIEKVRDDGCEIMLETKYRHTYDVAREALDKICAALEEEAWSWTTFLFAMETIGIKTVGLTVE